MKTQQARQRADQALDELTQALDAGQSESLQRFLAMQARFPRYSFGNVMLIAAQRPDATQVAGFRAWKRLGRYVKKGEKGIAIIAPMTIRKQDRDETERNEATLLFRAVHVFDIAQTDGAPLPEPASTHGEPGYHLARLRAHVVGSGIRLQYSQDLGSALGRSSGGVIELRSGLTQAEEFCTLAHELAHERMHKCTQNRPSKSVRETEAEAVAFVVAQAIGLDAKSAASDYIQLYDGDKETLAASLGRIQQTATVSIEAIMAPDKQSEAA